MGSSLTSRDLVIGISPFTEPDACLVAGVQRAGGMGVLDLGRGADTARVALVQAERWWPGAFGVRVPVGCLLSLAELPAAVDTVVLAPEMSWDAAAVAGRRLLIEVTGVPEAHAAREAHAAG